MKVAIVTLGCKVNLYDSAAVESHLRAGGCEIVPFAPGAEVYVVNTCAVTGRAAAESRRLARRARRWGGQSRVVVTGCFAQTDPHAAALPGVDFVVGVNRQGDLLRAVRGELDPAQGSVLVSNLRRALRVETMGAETFCGQTRGFLKVQEGCDLFCSFCVVPLARGRSRSVPPRVIVAQLERLAELGYREVVLTGTHLGSYGADLEPRADLDRLVEMIAERRPVPRVRLSSIDPPEVTAQLVRTVSQSDTICPHFHVPVQSGDDRVLARMRRRYDAALAEEVIASIREQLPEAGIGTDVIAGFPGETEAEFARTQEFLEKLPFTYLHVFPYSPRQGTSAAKLSESVERRKVTERARRLREIDRKKRRQFALSMIGKTAAVLLERAKGLETSGGLAGYTRNYARVWIAAPVSWVGREVPVRISGIRNGQLVAMLSDGSA